MDEITIDKNNAKKIVETCDAILAKMRQESTFEPGKALADLFWPKYWFESSDKIRREAAEMEAKIIRAFVAEVKRVAEVNARGNYQAIYTVEAMRQVLARYPETKTGGEA